ncbi:MAG TPA: hypothetical protein VE569_03105 [Acidimicrobiia bacterium]|jgi:hypothetical protein|nr:hypothetical protein [Acidimicrobiia bacterium]
MQLADATATTAGILLLTVAFIEYGGTFMLRVVRGGEFTGFQRSFFRAGHAHAGVLVLLSLVALLYADGLGLDNLLGWTTRSAIPLAAILMPAGFFFSAIGRGVERPNRFIVLIYAGAVSLGVGVVTLGIQLIGLS